MSGRTLGRVLLVLGVLIFLVAAAADRLGVGAASGFGWKQIVGVVVGIVLAVVGMVRLRSRSA